MRRLSRLLPAAVLMVAGALCTPLTQAADPRWQALGEHPEWLALLHYEHARSGSYVDDERFFLDTSGDRDPVAELRASVRLLAADIELRCRYIARYQWLRRQRLVPEDPQALTACAEYWQWRESMNAARVVLVFAASYLNSPSSMYGHTFLRFDPVDSRADSVLMSFALNFGASVPPRENSLLFAWRGLAGGYPGLFTMQPYYEKVQEYSRLENRDLWEYPLNLDGEELDRMLAHIWELRGINFAYYFFDENCSFRLLELLEVARPGTEITRQFRYYAIPVDTVRAVAAAGMIESVEYRPSRQVELQHLLDQMDIDDRRLAKALADDLTVAGGSAFQQRSRQQQQLIVLAAYRYLRYRDNRHSRDADAAERSLGLLRLLHSQGESETHRPERPLPPEQGHDTAMLSIGVGGEQGDAFVDVGLRVAYHDLLDPVAGYPGGASLNMGHVQFRAGESRAPRLQRLDLVEITSLAPRDRFFNPLSWQVNFGLERQFVGSRDYLARQVNGGFGATWRLGSVGGAALTPYVLATGRLEYNRGFQRNLQLAPGIRSGVLWQGDWGAVQADASHYRFLEEGEDRFQYALALQKHLGRNTGLRVSYSYRRHDEQRREAWKLALRRYF